MICRPVAEEDLPRLAQIYNHAVRETAATFDIDDQDTEHFRDFCLHHGPQEQRALVCISGRNIAGYAGVYPFSQRRAYSQLAELCCYVSPEYQRQGIGRELMHRVHRSGFLVGFHTILSLMNSRQSAYDKAL